MYRFIEVRNILIVAQRGKYVRKGLKNLYKFLPQMPQNNHDIGAEGSGAQVQPCRYPECTENI